MRLGKVSGDSQSVGITVGQVSDWALIERYGKLRNAVDGATRHAVAAMVAAAGLGAVTVATVAEHVAETSNRPLEGVADLWAAIVNAPFGNVAGEAGQMLASTPPQARLVATALLGVCLHCGIRAVRGWRSAEALREATGEIARRLRTGWQSQASAGLDRRAGRQPGRRQAASDRLPAATPAVPRRS